MPNQYVDPTETFVTDEEAAAIAKRFAQPIPNMPKLYCIGHVNEVLEVKDGANFNYVNLNIAGEFTSPSTRAKVMYKPAWLSPDANLTKIMQDAQEAMGSYEKGDPRAKPYSSIYYTIKNNLIGENTPSALEAVAGPKYGHILAMLAKIDANDNDAVLGVFRTFFATYGPITCGYQLKQSYRYGEPTKWYEVDRWWRPLNAKGQWNTRAFEAQAKEVNEDRATIAAARAAREQDPSVIVPPVSVDFGYEPALVG